MKPKVIQIAIEPGYDGPDNSAQACVFLLYDNGLIYWTIAGKMQWRLYRTPDEQAFLDGQTEENS
jgi:hypothetical protein